MPRSHVRRTTPDRRLPAYAETGFLCDKVLTSTTNSSSGASTVRSASAPTAIRPLWVSPTRSAGASAIHLTTSGRPNPWARAAVHTAGSDTWIDAMPPQANAKSPAAAPPGAHFSSVVTITACLGRFAPELLNTYYAEEMWLLFETGELRPDSVLTGDYTPDERDIDLDAIRHAINDAREEALIRQQGREAAAAEE